MMPGFHFRCSECATKYPSSEPLLVCSTCSRAQEPGGFTRGVLEVVLDDLPTVWPAALPESPEFLTAFLPLTSADHLPHLAVGGTPLLPVSGLRKELGMPHLWIKDDSRNPSGSTKDRASLLVVTKALEYGFDTVACASTGNAATALAAVAASVGVRAVVFVPRSAPEAKLVQMLSYGAEVFRVDGSYDQAFELCLEACRELGWYNRNTALNPFTIEGKKTSALEIAADLVPEEPDVVVVPVGDGVIISGVAKGFEDLEKAGLIQRRPRLIAVQPAGSAAIARAIRDGGTVTAVADAGSVADSLVVQMPRNSLLCTSQVRESQGGAVIVSDDQIIHAIARLARGTGIFAEPAAAAALAGLDVALDEGLVQKDERVVLLITGTGLKDVPAASRAVTRPSPIPPNLDAVIEQAGAPGKDG